MRARRGDAGAAAVEMALILPILMLLLFGLIDFGRAYNARITLSNAAREGVRVWALGGTEAETTQRVKDTAVGLTITSVTQDPCTFGARTQITVTASFSYLTPLISSFSPGLTSLSTNGVMRCGG